MITPSDLMSAVSPTVTCTRRLEIDAGHRLLAHEGKCRNYHGHRYVFEVKVAAPHLDAVGRVVDFAVIKEKVGGWLDRYWDHGMILEGGDPLIPALQQTGTKLYVVTLPPTAENLARIAFEAARRLLTPPLQVVRMRVYETPNCFADYP